MICLSVLVGFLLVLTAEARVGNSSELEFCCETEQCLLFDLICKTDDYEVRHYDSANWVSTKETSWFPDIAAIKAFKRLLAYIAGNNIKMTAPVLVKHTPTSFWQPGTCTMSFLLPVEHQKNPPKPTDAKVYTKEMPDMNVYVRSYGGWMMSWTEKNQADNLRNDLDKVGAEYKESFHYSAAYNSPMKLFNRHNEVWYLVEDEPMCTSSEELDLD
ncbi:heme-binding protein 2 [Lycodopsis pacificus]